MSMRGRAKKAAAAASGVALATAGLSSCSDNGAVDPPPPPLECSVVGNGQTLAVMGELDVAIITVLIQHIGVPGAFEGRWRSATIANLVGVSVDDIAVPTNTSESIVITLRLDSPDITEGSFTLQAVMEGFDGNVCPVTRTFNFTVETNTVTITQLQLDGIPLAARQRAEIVVLAQQDGVVELEGRTPYQGPHQMSWNVTNGSLETSGEGRVRWRLPEEAGMYQAELAIDYGEAGLAIDQIVFEVG
jgi:hypothetical protein